jgi:hypothetical protein
MRAGQAVQPDRRCGHDALLSGEEQRGRRPVVADEGQNGLGVWPPARESVE